MRILHSAFLVLSGTVFGIGLVLSCSDGSPSRVDAAVCDCPPSEAPLADRVVVKQSAVISIGPGQRSGAATSCDPGAQFLSGSCTTAIQQEAPEIVVEQQGFDKSSLGWYCNFKNNSPSEVQIQAMVLCLRPAVKM
jgi:hypothetical protein